MATTTNYGWTTPDDTALVKDGAAAIRSLGTAVDTTTKNLNPETTLGDIAYRSSTANTNTRLAIGSTGQILTVAGGVPSWATPAGGAGSTLINTTTFSAVASQSVNNVFSSTYTNYKILIRQTGANSGPGGVTLKLRASGTDTSANYRCIRLGADGTSPFTSVNQNGTDEWYTGLDTGSNLGIIELTVFNPQSSAPTLFNGSAYSAPASIQYIQLTSGVQTDSTSFDGFTLLVNSGDFTGTIYTYGLAI